MLPLLFWCSCNCMPHMLSYMELYNPPHAPPNHQTTSPSNLVPHIPRIDGAQPLNDDITIKKRFTRLNVGKLTTWSVSGFTVAHTKKPQHTQHSTTPPHTDLLKPKDFYCTLYTVLIDTFYIWYFNGLKSQFLKCDKLYGGLWLQGI